MNCPRCSNEAIVAWAEPSMLTSPPKDWPDDLPYPEQPVEEAQHLVCMACGYEAHDIVGLDEPPPDDDA